MYDELNCNPGQGPHKGELVLYHPNFRPAMLL